MQDRVMHTTHLREIDGMVMVVIPPAFHDQVHLGAGASVATAIDSNRLVITPRTAPRYTLDDLLASIDPAALTGDKDDLFLGHRLGHPSCCRTGRDEHVTFARCQAIRAIRADGMRPRRTVAQTAEPGRVASAGAV